MSFVQARQRAVDRIFVRLGEDAVWNDASEPVRVITRESDELAEMDEPGLVVATNFVRVRRSEVAEPLAGDVVEPQESGGRFIITGSPRLDRKGIWRCEVLEAVT